MRSTAISAVSACAAALATAVLFAAGAAALPDPPAPVTGNATWFDGLGQPYGGCGLPQANLDSQDFVALNVFNTPNDYAYSTRPVPDAAKIGMWDNGRNCGRWVEVTMGDNCTGINDGAPNQPFCRNGSFVSDAYNGGVLRMLVADSCGDSNAWCRDDPYHLDLAKASLNRFVKNGTALSDLYPSHWNNRHISWKFVPAPDYTGDIGIGFLQGAQQWWPAISVSHLANGIHGVEFFANGAWQTATMNSDMGQSYIIGGTTTGGTQFQIRVRDVTGALINGGRLYNFTLPCASQCSVPYTAVTYTTSGGSSSSASPSASSSGSASPSASPSRSASPSPSRSVSPSPSSSPSAGACSATYTIVNTWPGGFSANVNVTAGSAAITSWTVRWTFTAGQTITQLWNGTLTSSGSAITVKNATFNGNLSPGASALFGFNGTWNGSNPVPTVTCATP